MLESLKYIQGKYFKLHEFVVTTYFLNFKLQHFKKKIVYTISKNNTMTKNMSYQFISVNIKQYLILNR